jgi:hypothetical protein
MGASFRYSICAYFLAVVASADWVFQEGDAFMIEPAL